jgi:hypothetical protein
MIPYGWTYCPDCKPLAEAERQAKQERRSEYLRKKSNQRYNARRGQEDPKYRKFRNSKPWKETSKAKLRDCKWKCEARLEGCQGIACEVHHKQPLKTPEGWEKRLDWDNLQGVCTACHNLLDNKEFKKKIDENVIDLRTIQR